MFARTFHSRAHPTPAIINARWGELVCATVYNHGVNAQTDTTTTPMPANVAPTLTFPTNMSVFWIGPSPQYCSFMTRAWWRGTPERGGNNQWIWLFFLKKRQQLAALEIHVWDNKLLSYSWHSGWLQPDKDTLSPESSDCPPLPPGSEHIDMWLEKQLKNQVLLHLVFSLRLHTGYNIPPYVYRAVFEQFLDVLGHTRSSHTFRVWAANVPTGQSEERKRRHPVSNWTTTRGKIWGVRWSTVFDSPPTL